MVLFSLCFLIFNLLWKEKRAALFLCTLCQAIVMGEAERKGDCGANKNFGRAVAFKNIFLNTGAPCQSRRTIALGWQIIFLLFINFTSVPIALISAGFSDGRGRKDCDLSVQGRNLDFCFPKETAAGEEERVQDKSLWCSHGGGKGGSAESHTE